MPAADDEGQPASVASPRGARVTIGRSFSERRNSLNLLRLVLAGVVLVDHAIPLGGGGDTYGNILNKTAPGLLAVYCFFGISGFLIAGSATRNSIGRYMWQRSLRILPAFWVCLLVTAFVFGLIGWYHHNPRCGIPCYIRTPYGPLQYVLNNFWLRSNQNRIASTLYGVPIPLAWNGSTWSLFYEFLCYLVLGTFAVIGLLRHRWAVAVLAAGTWIAELIITSFPSLNNEFNVFRNIDIYKMLELLPVFLVGSVLYLYRDKIPDSGVLALACVGVCLVSLVIPLGNHYPAYTITSADLFAPALAYPMIWLGIHLPFQTVGAHNDYSYGVYIYAYPVSQLLALWGVYRWGIPAYVALVVLLTGAFAATSWWLIEKRALRLKKLAIRPPLSVQAEDSSLPEAAPLSTPITD